MNRQQKEQVIESLKQDFNSSSASFLVGYRGLTVAELNNLRKKLKPAEGSLRVAKVTLIERAIANKPQAEELKPYLVDQLAVIFSHGDSPSVAKILNDFSKVTIVAGYYENQVLTADTVKAFAQLPSREVLLARVCGVLKMPLARLPLTLTLLRLRLIVALKELQKKKV